MSRDFRTSRKWLAKPAWSSTSAPAGQGRPGLVLDPARHMSTSLAALSGGGAPVRRSRTIRRAHPAAGLLPGCDVRRIGLAEAVVEHDGRGCRQRPACAWNRPRRSGPVRRLRRSPGPPARCGVFWHERPCRGRRCFSAMESLRPRVTAISSRESLRDGSGRRAPSRRHARPVAGKHHFQLRLAGDRPHGPGHGLLERLRIGAGLLPGRMLSPGRGAIGTSAHHDVDGGFRQFLAEAALIELGHQGLFHVVALVQEGQAEGKPTSPKIFAFSAQVITVRGLMTVDRSPLMKAFRVMSASRTILDTMLRPSGFW
jgi:hypothetical protein